MKERSLFANSAWGVLSNVFRVLIGFAFVPVFVAKLGVEGYGIFGILMLFSFAQGLMGQIDLGFLNYVVKANSRNASETAIAEFQNHTQGFLFLFFGLQTLVYGGVFVFRDILENLLSVSLEHREDFQICLLIVLVTNLISSLGSYYAAFLASQHRNVFIKKTETVVFLIFNVGSILGLMFVHQVQVVAWVFFGTQVLQTLILIYFCRQIYPIQLSFGFPTWSHFASRWAQWKPFLFSKMSGLAFRQTDTMIVSFLLGPQMVGMYEIAMKFPLFLKSTNGRISEVLVPFSSARQSENDNRRIGKILDHLLFFQAAISLLLMIACVFFGKQLLFVWMGKDFSNLWSGLIIACGVPVFATLCSAPGALFLGRDDRLMRVTWGPTVAAVLNLAISIPMTFYYGLEGTILATVLQYLFFGIIFVGPLKQDFYFDFFKLGKRLVIFSAIVSVYFAVVKSILPVTDSRAHLAWNFFGIFSILGLLLLAIYLRSVKDLRSLMAIKATRSGSELT